jgi:hypothetical protein
LVGEGSSTHRRRFEKGSSSLCSAWAVAVHDPTVPANAAGKKGGQIMTTVSQTRPRGGPRVTDQPAASPLGRSIHPKDRALFELIDRVLDECDRSVQTARTS